MGHHLDLNGLLQLSEPDLVQDRQKDFDLGKKPGMGKGDEWSKSQMTDEQNGGGDEEEEENGERIITGELEAALNHRIDEEMAESNKVKLNIRMPDLVEAERAKNLQIDEGEDRGEEGGIGIGKMAAGGGHISPVSDF